MLNRIAIGILVVALVATASAQTGNRASLSEKGSLLIFPKVECFFDAENPNAPGTNTLKDTFISVTNDIESGVEVHVYYISDDCRYINTHISMSHNHPVWFAASTGAPGPFNHPVAPFWGATQTGFPYWDADAGAFVARGAIVMFAVDIHTQQIRHNFLAGEATIVDYVNSTAFDYKAYAFKVHTTGGAGVAGHLAMDGVTYDAGFNTLLFDFFAAGSMAFSSDLADVTHDTDLTLLIQHIDLRMNPGGLCGEGEELWPYHTLVSFEWIWNENETPFSNENYCIRKWDSRLLSNVLGGFDINLLATNRGYARINGVYDPSCDVYDVVHNPPDEEMVESCIDTPLLGVAAKILEFSTGTYAVSGGAMRGSGEQTACLLYDIPGGGEEQPQEGAFGPSLETGRLSR